MLAFSPTPAPTSTPTPSPTPSPTPRCDPVDPLRCEHEHTVVREGRDVCIQPDAGSDCIAHAGADAVPHSRAHLRPYARPDS